MNATTFFSREAFDRLKQDILAERKIGSEQYAKKYRINGNTYGMSIFASHYNFGEHKYFVSLWYDYNYPGPYQSRNIGGGNGGRVVIESYEAFCAAINEILRIYPDYKEPVFEPEQLSLF